MLQTQFTRLLERQRPLLLDGGLATQLEAQGCDIDNVLWSAALLRTAPDQIVAAHRAYLAAGAECISSASYQASREGFAKLGLSADDADAAMSLSIELAVQAATAIDRDVAIAASLGPYGAMLHDGSEYSGQYGVSRQTLHDFHEARLTLFARSPADVLALETIPSLQEAEVLADLLRQQDKPCWISFSCRDGTRISDGTPLAGAAELFATHPTVVAVGVNCTPPQYLLSLLGELQTAVPDKYLIAYPNSGETYNVADNSWSGTTTPGDCADAARGWLDAGANLIGGCCRMGPRHIAAMAAAIQ